MFAVAAVIFAILAAVIYGNWQELRDYQFTIDYRLLAVSFALFVTALFMLGFGWGLILERLGAKLPVRMVLNVWFVSQFTRWIPGNLWSVVSMLYLSRGISKATVGLSAVLGVILNLVAGLVVVLGLFYWWPGQVMQGYPLLYFAPVVILISLLFAYPRVVNRAYDNAITRHLLRRLGRERYLDGLPGHTLRRTDLGVILGFYILCWGVSGIGFHFFAESFVSLSPALVPASILIYAFSWVVSYLAFVTPSGLGVKEAVTTAMLARWIPVGAAAVVSIALRIWIIVCELFCLLLVRCFLGVRL
jgi:hypothetical protein